MSSKWFKENGRLSEGGEVLLSGLKAELIKLFNSADVEEMTTQQLWVLQSNLATMVGEAVSTKIHQKSNPKPSDQELRDAVAQGMKEWALVSGTHDSCFMDSGLRYKK